jgi:hypothetical protein
VIDTACGEVTPIRISNGQSAEGERLFAYCSWLFRQKDSRVVGSPRRFRRPRIGFVVGVRSPSRNGARSTTGEGIRIAGWYSAFLCDSLRGRKIIRLAILQIVWTLLDSTRTVDRNRLLLNYSAKMVGFSRGGKLNLLLCRRISDKFIDSMWVSSDVPNLSIPAPLVVKLHGGPHSASIAE